MAIRWVSTPESTNANQPSVLAIVETLLAMGISIWIAVTWKTYIHIAIGACIAPLLLMRTDESCIRAAKYARAFDNVRDRLAAGYYHSLQRLLFMALWCLAMGAILVAASMLVSPELALIWFLMFVATSRYPAMRVIAWFESSLRTPAASIAAIPENWRHATMALDSWRSPHLLHPPKRVNDECRGLEFPTVRDYFLELRSCLPDHHFRFYISALYFVIVLVSVPAYAYRWSIKSTAIIWFPLLWAMHSTKSVAGPLHPCLDIYRRDPITKIVLWVSIASLTGFAIKLILHYEWAGFVEWWNDGPLRHFLSLYVAPAEVPRWQLAIAINSTIAIVMYVLAGHWLVRLEHKRLADETWPRRVFQTGLFIRPILSCYTIACTLYITSIAAWDLEWPALGDQWFPWQ